MITFHALHTPMKVIGTAADDRPTRWCFNCRKHLPHTWELLATVEPSYYDSDPVIRCSRCNEDHTVHPGSYRDGPAQPSNVVWAALVNGQED